MKLEMLHSRWQFYTLKKGDLVVVRWKPGSLEYKNGNEVGHYNMVEINRNNEIILKKRTNIYFIIDMYLRGESHAAEAYVLKREA